MQELQRPVHDLPLAVSGLTSYRCKGRYEQWIMIGAKDDADAWREAARSTDHAHGMERWDEAAQEYRPIAAALRCAMTADCPHAVGMIDSKGYVYCGPHGLSRRGGGIRCRVLTAAELKRLQAGEALARY